MVVTPDWRMMQPITALIAKTNEIILGSRIRQNSCRLDRHSHTGANKHSSAAISSRPICTASLIDTSFAFGCSRTRLFFRSNRPRRTASPKLSCLPDELWSRVRSQEQSRSHSACGVRAVLMAWVCEERGKENEKRVEHRINDSTVDNCRTLN